MSAPPSSGSEKTTLLCPWSSVGTAGAFAGAGIGERGGNWSAVLLDATAVAAPWVLAACCSAFIAEDKSSKPDMPLSRLDWDIRFVTDDCGEEGSAAGLTASGVWTELSEPAVRPPAARLRRFMPVNCDDGPR
jgi:hypothetical protein